MENEYRTVKQAAAELGGVSASLVYGLCKAGRLDHIRIGVGRGTIRIPQAAIDRMKQDGRGPIVAEHPPLKHVSVT